MVTRVNIGARMINGDENLDKHLATILNALILAVSHEFMAPNKSDSNQFITKFSMYFKGMTRTRGMRRS